MPILTAHSYRVSQSFRKRHASFPCFGAHLPALLCAGLTLLLVSCAQEQETPATQGQAVRLFDVFEPEDVEDALTAAAAGLKPILWTPASMSAWQPAEEAPPLGFRALQEVDPVDRSDSALTGQVTGEAPVLQFALGQNRGGADRIKFIEVRMKVEAGSQVWLRAEGGREVDDSGVIEWAKGKEWNRSVDVVTNEFHTYRFEVTPERGGGPGGPPPGGPPPGDGGPPPGDGGPPPDGPDGGVPPLGRPPPNFGRPPGGSGGRGDAPDVRHVFLSVREAKGARFAIESVRLISDREDLLNEPSGQKWAGLAEVYRETLAAKSSETIRIPLSELPARPWLDVAIGTVEDDPITFTVAVVPSDGGETESGRVVLERTVTTPDRWYPLRVDLSSYAGKSVVMEMSLSGEKKGLLGYWGSPVIRSSLDPAGERAAAGKKPRGVIFFVADTLRPDHLNIYGYERETLVHLKKFAAEGVSFRNAIAQGTWTKVSQPSMVTSLYPATHGVLDFAHSLPASAETLAEVYREAGYATLCYSSVPFTGKMNNMHQGYEELHESNSVREDRETYGSKTARPYVDRLIPWLEQHRDVPFFVYLHVFDPHSPFRPRPPYDTLWAKPEDKERMAEIDADIKKHKVKNIFGLPSKEEYVSKTGNDPDEYLRIVKDWYDGSIRGMDAEMGRLFQALREMGLEDDTLIVFSSDHGEEFWEHGRLFHGHSVYGELSRVPLVFRWPNQPGLQQGTTVDRLVENVDIMPTLLELSGIPGPSRMQGRSLVPLLDGSGASTWEDRLVVTQTLLDDEDDSSQNGPHFGFIQDGLKVVRKELDPSPVEELYDPASDPLDLKNLIDGEGQRARADALTETFVAWKKGREGEVLPGDDEVAAELSSEELRRLQALGYVGGGVKTKTDTNAPAQPPGAAPTP